MNRTEAPLTRILAATDLSVPAREAAGRAARLAREHGAALTLLHVLQQGALDDLRQWLGAPLAEQMQGLAARELGALGAELGRGHGPGVDLRLEPGAVLPTLGRVADEIDADLLVLGARGAGVVRRFLLGATAERLLRHTTRPVLVVRRPADEPYRRALLALDFSRSSDEVLLQARRVVPTAHWVLCNVVRVPFERELSFAGVDEATVTHYREQARAEAAARLRALAEGAGLAPGRWEPCIVEGDASLRLMEQQQALACDVTVIGKHGRSATEDLLLGSVTKHVLAGGEGDVLVVARPVRSAAASRSA